MSAPKAARKGQMLTALREVRALLLDAYAKCESIESLTGILTYRVMDALEPGSGQAEYHRRMDALWAARVGPK